MLHLHTIGLGIRHTGDFCIDRPAGSGDYLLIIFKTDALLNLDGHELHVQPDSIMIFSRHTSQFYKTYSGSYINHFLHFDVDTTDELDGIIFDKLLIADNINEAETLLRMISREQFSGSNNREEYISMLIKMLLMKLSEPTVLRSRKTIHHLAAFNELRAQIYSNPAQFESIAQLAKIVNLSPSHFQQLYKTQFGIGCYEDLLTAKMKAAQYYLSNTSLSVKEIAELCGYDNVKCFLHRFKDRVGMTPSEYRWNS